MGSNPTQAIKERQEQMNDVPGKYDSFPSPLLLYQQTYLLYLSEHLQDVAQLGRALRSGRRGRRFNSCHLDLNVLVDKKTDFFIRSLFFCFLDRFLFTIKLER